MKGCFLVLGALLHSVAGCVMVPVKGTVDKVDVPPALSSPMAAGEKLAILGSKTAPDDGDFVTCIQSATAKADATLHLIAAQDFRDALFPWFEPSTAPWTAEQIALSISHPAVKAKLSEMNVHYVVLIRGDTRTSTPEVYGVLSPISGGAGFGKETQTSELSGRIIDLEQGNSPGSLALSVSAPNSATSLLLLTVYTLAMTETPACEEYGRQLTAYLTGKPAPGRKPVHTEAPDK